MIRLDYFVVGYVEYKISKNDISRVAEIFLNESIAVKFNEDGSFFASLLNARKIESAMLGKIEFEKSLPLGIGGFLTKIRFRYGAIFALILSAFLFFYLGGKVWDVRVDGVPAELCETVKSELAQNGLSVGERWSGINKSHIEAAVLNNSDFVSWININRRGGVAYVTAALKEVHKTEERPSGYANVIAARDCIIEDITVRSGVAVVKVGQSVKRGDLLISGIIPTELGGGFCYADGEVRGRYSDSVSVTVPRVENYKVYADEYIKSLSINIFNFSLNIFKNYSNSSAMCDIIEEKSEFLLDGGKTLPFSLNKALAREYTVKTRNLTDKEMSERASQKMRESLSSFLADKELLSIETYGKLGEGGYDLSASMVLCGNVAKISDFEFKSEK